MSNKIDELNLLLRQHGLSISQRYEPNSSMAKTQHEIIDGIRASVNTVNANKTRDQVLKELSVMEEEAKAENEKFVKEVKAKFAARLTQYMETVLKDFQYDTEVNDAVHAIVRELSLDEYNPHYNFWLPSNLDC